MADPMVSTVIACITPPGKAAVATLALRGLLAWPVTRALFRPRHGTLPETPVNGKLWLGQLGEDMRDEVVLAVKRDTPEVWLELHCHGGPAVVRMIEELYARRAVRVTTWQELERSTSGPAWQIAAQERLVQAPTARTAAILLDQYEGAMHRAGDEVQAALSAGRVDAARKLVDRLARHAALGRHLVRPWSVVIAGAPNVGKSSLANALAGYTRSVVAASPGTTRDVTTTTLAIDGWPIVLSDTAGLRDADGAIEAEGVVRARAAVMEADLCLWLLDGSQGDASCVAYDADTASCRVVINKTDLAPGLDWSRFPEAPRTSALTRAGVPELCAAISRWLVPAPPAPGEAVPFSPALCDAVEQARRLVHEGRIKEAQVLLDPR